MAGSYYKLDDTNDVDLHLNAVPRWIKFFSLPVLVFVLLALPVALAFIDYPETLNVEIEVRPREKSISLDTIIKVNEAFTDGAHVKPRDVIGWGKLNQAVTAPVTGTVHFNFGVDDAILVPIIQPMSTEVLASALINIDQLESVKPGQKVLVEFSQYPKDKFGYLEFTTAQRSFSSINGKYVVRLNRLAPWITTGGRVMKFSQETKGRGRLFVEERSILERMSASILKAK